MIILISGATHTGKTRLAQQLLEKYRFPYLSIDHLKMGLIRSGNTDLTVYDDERLTPYLWNIVKEMIKTAIENKQNFIVEGCYIPFEWKKDFSAEYLKEIKQYCLVMTADYIEQHFDDIKKYENCIESRICADLSKEELVKENAFTLEMCRKCGCNYILIDKNYETDIELKMQ